MAPVVHGIIFPLVLIEFYLSTQPTICSIELIAVVLRAKVIPRKCCSICERR